MLVIIRRVGLFTTDNEVRKEPFITIGSNMKLPEPQVAIVDYWHFPTVQRNSSIHSAEVNQNAGLESLTKGTAQSYNPQWHPRYIHRLEAETMPWNLWCTSQKSLVKENQRCTLLELLCMMKHDMSIWTVQQWPDNFRFPIILQIPLNLSLSRIQE